MDGEVNLVTHAQEKRAWVLQSPFHVRNRKCSRRRGIAILYVGVDGQRHGMRLAMHAEFAIYHEMRLAPAAEGTSKPLRAEDDFGIFIAFQNLLVHLLVAGFVAAVSAGCIHHDFAGRLAAGIIQFNGAPFEPKLAMDGVHNTAETEIDFALRGIKRE